MCPARRSPPACRRSASPRTCLRTARVLSVNVAACASPPLAVACSWSPDCRSSSGRGSASSSCSSSSLLPSSSGRPALPSSVSTPGSKADGKACSAVPGAHSPTAVAGVGASGSGVHDSGGPGAGVCSRGSSAVCNRRRFARLAMSTSMSSSSSSGWASGGVAAAPASTRRLLGCRRACLAARSASARASTDAVVAAAHRSLRGSLTTPGTAGCRASASAWSCTAFAEALALFRLLPALRNPRSVMSEVRSCSRARIVAPGISLPGRPSVPSSMVTSTRRCGRCAAGAGVPRVLSGPPTSPGAQPAAASARPSPGVSVGAPSTAAPSCRGVSPMAASSPPGVPPKKVGVCPAPRPPSGSAACPGVVLLIGISPNSARGCAGGDSMGPVASGVPLAPLSPAPRSRLGSSPGVSAARRISGSSTSSSSLFRASARSRSGEPPSTMNPSFSRSSSSPPSNSSSWAGAVWNARALKSALRVMESSRTVNVSSSPSLGSPADKSRLSPAEASARKSTWS
mmetsp:Transcript_36757/g.87327  ORF Transcript_36757/g.87327 Transcript_36757/m.87327 type:complete len:514 (-) Transcript_36757:577-2118(-)